MIFLQNRMEISELDAGIEYLHTRKPDREPCPVCKKNTIMYFGQYNYGWTINYICNNCGSKFENDQPDLMCGNPYGTLTLVKEFETDRKPNTENMTCCATSYKFCNAFPKCPAGLKVKVPTFTGQANAVDLRNGQGQGNLFGYLESDIVDGFVEVDLATLPDQFLNPFGSPYKIRFLDNLLETIEFVANDGTTCEDIIFFVDKVANGDYVLEIDAMV